MPFVTPQKSLGQNFLRDENIARNIITGIRPTADDVIVEIGPGHGVLTKYFVNNVTQYIAYEIDARVIEELQSTFASPTVRIVHQDFLDVSLRNLAREYAAPLRIVGNIPYNITTPILFQILDNAERGAVVSDVTIMMQKDVAQRLIALPRTKAYGILSIFAQYYTDVKILFSVSPNCFYPAPNVMSAIVQLKIKKNAACLENENVFRTIVRTAFGKRRKVLRNALQYYPGIEQLPDSGKKLLADVFEKAHISLDMRPEELSVADFVNLSNAFTGSISEFSSVE